jgi:hypothetical protein
MPNAGVHESALRVDDPGDRLLGADNNRRWNRDWKDPASIMAHKGKDALPVGSNILHVDGSVTWNFSNRMALNRRTIRDKRPEVVAIDHPDAMGKYDNWKGIREYFW